MQSAKENCKHFSNEYIYFGIQDVINTEEK